MAYAQKMKRPAHARRPLYCSAPSGDAMLTSAAASIYWRGCTLLPIATILSQRTNVVDFPWFSASAAIFSMTTCHV